MPLSKFQSEVLSVIAASRSPESYVAGGVPINRTGARISSDIDIFHAREDAVAAAAGDSERLLQQAGFQVSWLRRQPGIHVAVISKKGGSTRLEWVADSDFRYFPAIPDPEFGYVLHPVDLAINKVSAAAGRREVRDIVDLLRVDAAILPLGSLAWAAVAIAPGFSPESLLAEIKRNARYTTEDFRALDTERPLDPAHVLRELSAAVERAEGFVASMPSEEVGTIYLDTITGIPVQPDPARLDVYLRHLPQRKGHWPSSSDMTGAMLDRLKLPLP